MTELSRSNLQKLAEQKDSICISIYMPAEKAGAETRKNPIRFKNSLREAEDKIEQIGSSTKELVAPLQLARAYFSFVTFGNADFYNL